MMKDGSQKAIWIGPFVESALPDLLAKVRAKQIPVTNRNEVVDKLELFPQPQVRP